MRSLIFSTPAAKNVIDIIYHFCTSIHFTGWYGFQEINFFVAKRNFTDFDFNFEVTLPAFSDKMAKKNYFAKFRRRNDTISQFREIPKLWTVSYHTQ